jgi:hypothetical protein
MVKESWVLKYKHLIFKIYLKIRSIRRSKGEVSPVPKDHAIEVYGVGGMEAKLHTFRSHW